MTAAQPHQGETSPRHPVEPSRTTWSDRRAALITPALMTAVAVLLLLGSVLMSVPEASGFLGPRFFPLAVSAFLLVAALVSTTRALRPTRPQNTPPQAPQSSHSNAGTDEKVEEEVASQTRSDWRTLAITAVTLVGHVILLQPLGWLIAGTLLFWGISYALDSRRPLFDLCIAATLAGVAQLVFSGLLDVALPAGLLGKVL